MSTSAELEWSPTLQAILGPDPGSRLYGEVSVWFHKLGMFRNGENQRIHLVNPTPEDLEIHRHLLLRLITDGEHLLKVVEQSRGLIQNPEAIKSEDLSGAISGLHDTYRGWHQAMPGERRAEILREVFTDVS